ncbi:MAG: aminomethyl-transferring glycine dehydrogenase subunit GcvPB, partial [Angelakisella sp.]
GVSAKDVAKAMLDRGMHPPTMYFPLIVEEALMLEPTETESKETLDAACDAIIAILRQCKEDADTVKAAPLTTQIGRPDEVTAARTPKLRYEGVCDGSV